MKAAFKRPGERNPLMSHFNNNSGSITDSAPSFCPKRTFWAIITQRFTPVVPTAWGHQDLISLKVTSNLLTYRLL
jgi:hypothetical protein